MAHLLELGGESELVQRIARERNHARVRELASEPRLIAWLTAAGLTLEEAAAIQPSYWLDHGACVCGGSEWGTEVPPISGVAPAGGVLVGTAVSSTDQSAVMRIDSLYGEVTGYEVGQEVAVQPHEGETISLEAKLVVPVHLVDGNVVHDAGGDMLRAVVLDDDGTYTCESGGRPVGPLSQQELIDVVTAPECEEALGALNPAWVKRSRGDDMAVGCSAFAGETAQETPTTLSILLVLVAAIAARRAGGAR